MNPTPLDKFSHWEKETPDAIFLRQPIAGTYREYSYASAGNQIRSVAQSLLGLNLPPRSNIAILSKNCAHWIMADLAIWMAGHVSVPLYPNLTSASIKQILDHSDSKAIFVGKLDDYKSQKPGIPDSIQKISFPLYGVDESLRWDDLVEANAKPHASSPAWNDHEVVTIMYTSGTTGVPKGVMFTFPQMMWTAETAAKALQSHFDFPWHPKLFSYLPLCHIAERMITECTGIIMGAKISFAESLDTFARDLSATQPHLFFGVPRIYSRFQEKILEKLPQKRLNAILKIPILNGLFRKKLKKALGMTDAKVIGAGAAPVAPALIDWFGALGITVRDIYGMTETCGFCSFNLMSIKTGSVGQAWPGVEVKLGNDGEILTRHPGNMAGYFKEPGMTRDIFTDDNYIKTGDTGTIDQDGFLTITGRIKDIFKTDKGKYVAPAPIEMKLLANADVDQVCVVGMGIPQPIGLAILSSSGKSKSKEQLTASLMATLETVNGVLESYEKLQAIVIMNTDWSIENGLLTPTLKVKRNEVEKLKVPRYREWYERRERVVWES